MSTDTAQPGSWRPRSMWAGVLMVFLLQVGMIFWLGETRPIHPRRPAAAPVLQLVAQGNSEFLSLTDPSLLALPHDQGFSGLAWVLPPPLTNADYHPSEKEKSWTDDAHWLALSGEQLGAGLNSFAPGNFAGTFDASLVPEPRLASYDTETQLPLSGQSTLRMEGVLAQWRAVNAFALPSWPARFTTATDTDLLTNSVVQLVVDTQGRPVSATLLSSSGLADADNFALDQARVSRFDPPGGTDPNAALRANPLLGLCWGRLIFQWYTVPVTNRPAGTPSS